MNKTQLKCSQPPGLNIAHIYIMQLEMAKKNQSFQQYINLQLMGIALMFPRSQNISKYHITEMGNLM